MEKNSKADSTVGSTVGLDKELDKEKEVIMTKQAAAQAVVVARGLFKLFPLASAMKATDSRETKEKSNG